MKKLLGVDLGGATIKIGLFESDLKKIAEKKIATEAHKGSNHVLHLMASGIQSLLEENDLSNHDILSMGMGIPGLLDREKGISIYSPNFTNWKNVPIGLWFENKLQIPVIIDNDVRMNLYGEWKQGAGIQKQNIVLFTLGANLGASVLINGAMYYGCTENAGDIGHMHLYPTGRPCYCGSSGCLGKYVSAAGMIQTVQEKLSQKRSSILKEWSKNDMRNMTAKMISEAFDADDAVAKETLQETGVYLGYGLVNIIHLYNPEMIIIGGGVAEAGERLLHAARKIVEKNALDLPQKNCTITLGKLGDSAGIAGAALYGYENTLKK